MEEVQPPHEKEGYDEVLSHHKGTKGQNVVLKGMLDVSKPSATFTAKKIKHGIG